MKSKYKKSVEIIAITLALTSYLPLADSCTRALYVGADNRTHHGLERRHAYGFVGITSGHGS